MSWLELKTENLRHMVRCTGAILLFIVPERILSVHLRNEAQGALDTLGLKASSVTL